MKDKKSPLIKIKLHNEKEQEKHMTKTYYERKSPVASKEPSKKEWAEFSMTDGVTVDQIKERMFNNGNFSVCFAYLCRFADLNDENFEEFLALSTNTCTPENPSSNVDDLRKNYDNNVKIALEKLSKGKVRSRVSWFDIVKYQNISMRLLKKYGCDPRNRDSVLEGGTWYNGN